MKTRMSPGDTVLYGFICSFMVVIMVITLYPFWYVLVCSFSNADIVDSTVGLVLWFRGFDLKAYEAIFKYDLIWTAYANTIFYATVGTSVNLLLTTMGAYALSRRSLIGANLIMKLVVFTMYFSGGLIPLYLIVSSLGLLNTRMALIIPSAISGINLIIMRTSFQGVPVELEEAAIIDGASPYQIMRKIIIPLSVPVIMVIGLYYLVGHWNKYFDGLIYLTDTQKYPLQLVLRSILIKNGTSELMEKSKFANQRLSQTIKDAAIMVSVIPIICVYPFIQKFFIQGVMIGAIKG